MPIAAIAIVLASTTACERSDAATRPAKQTLLEARKGFQTKLITHNREKIAVDLPRAGVFEIGWYEAPLGKNAAYVTPDPKNGKKHPAIIWIHGGDCNSIGDVWSPYPEDNEQSASAFRKAGIVMMFPSLRGGNENAGEVEGYLGEVDDIIAAADYLARKPYVDPKRIYLGGHSTGGTMALLVSECTDKFRAVFCFGPVSDVSDYGPRFGPPVNLRDRREISLRSPAQWLDGIVSPTFVLEATQRGNLDSLEAMAAATRNPKVHFVRAKVGTHFTILSPVNTLLAKKILADAGEASNIAVTEAEVAEAMQKH